MSKRKRGFESGDVVEWEDAEWVVGSEVLTRVSPAMPRHVSNTGLSLLPVDDWRVRLRVSDFVEVFRYGRWFLSRIIGTSPFVVRPVFTHMSLEVEGCCLRRTSAKVPDCALPVDEYTDRQFFVNEVSYVAAYRSGEYLVTKNFYYISLSQVTEMASPSASRVLVKTLPVVHGTSFATSSSILSALRQSQSRLHACWMYAREYLWKNVCVNLNMVSRALDRSDSIAVCFLTMVFEYRTHYYAARWLDWQSSALPYFEFEFTSTSCALYWSGQYLSVGVMQRWVAPLFAPSPDATLRTALLISPVSTVSTGDLYGWQRSLVWKMRVLESRNPISHAMCSPTEDDEVTFNPHVGMVSGRHVEQYGGVLCVESGLGKTWIALALCRLVPRRTLVVVPVRMLDHWSMVAEKLGVPVSVWYSRSRPTELQSVVLTTPGTVVRGLPETTFDRLIVDDAHLVGIGSQTMHILSSMCRYRWYLSANPDIVGYRTLLGVFPYHSSNYTLKRTEYDTCLRPYILHTSWTVLQRLSLVFPVRFRRRELVVSLPPVYQQILDRIRDRGVSRGFALELLTLLRYSPALLPPQYLHEKLEEVCDSLESIAACYTVPLSQLESQTKCAICLSKFERTTVTSCGHLFCRECLSAWNGGCPLCRAPIKTTMGVGTPTPHVFINGQSYRAESLPTTMGSVVESIQSSVELSVEPRSTVFVCRSSLVAADLCQRLGGYLMTSQISCGRRRTNLLRWKSEKSCLFTTLESVEGICLGIANTLFLMDEFTLTETCLLKDRLRRVGREVNSVDVVQVKYVPLCI